MREGKRAGKLREGEGNVKAEGGVGQRGLKKARKGDAASEDAETERLKDGGVGQEQPDGGRDAAETRPELRAEDRGRDESSEQDFRMLFAVTPDTGSRPQRVHILGSTALLSSCLFPSFELFYVP